MSESKKVKTIIVIVIVFFLLSELIYSMYKERYPGPYSWRSHNIHALALLKILTSVNEQYKQKYGTYAPRGADLANAGLISGERGETMDDGNESDFNFTYRGAKNAYECYANPMTETSYDCSFFVNESGDIRIIENRSATQHKSGGAKWTVLGK